MSGQYYLRSNSAYIARIDDLDFTEPDAESSTGAPSSPVFTDSDDIIGNPNIPFLDLGSDYLPDNDFRVERSQLVNHVCLQRGHLKKVDES